MDYISKFISWLKWKDTSNTFVGFLWYIIGIVVFKTSTLFIIIPSILFLLTQYFYYVWETEYLGKYYKLTKEDIDTEFMLEKFIDTIPKVLRFSAYLFVIVNTIIYILYF